MNSCGPKPAGPSSLSTERDPGVRYVSRGGAKLRGALDVLPVAVQDRVALDIGSSTGGFTDCLLKAGAKSVWCVDVGYGLLDYTLRKDPRVHVLERTNVRYLAPSLLTEKPDLVTVDVSFIALEKVLPKIAEVLAPEGDVLAMVKPQFEGSPKEAPGGVVRDEAVRERVVEDVCGLARSLGFTEIDVIPSPLLGPAGNREFLAYMRRLER